MTVVMGTHVSWVALTFIGSVGYAAGLYLAWRFGWRQLDYAVCKQCGYDLRGQKGLGAGQEECLCPECGQPLDEETVERASARFARRPIHYAIAALLVVTSLLLSLCISVGLLSLLTR